MKRQGISLLTRMGRRPSRGRILRGAGAKVTPPLGREAQKGFSVGLLGLSRKARFDFGWKDGTFTVNEWEGCFSLLVQILQTCLHLATHVHLPSLDFFFFPPTELRKEKSNSRNVRRKISLRSDDTWPMLKVVGKRTLRLANCIRVFSTM